MIKPSHYGHFFWTFLLVFFFAQETARARVAERADLSQSLPNDPRVIRGSLPNGLTYYIRANKKPENRAELRLVVKAGSIQEDDDQKGLAHFVEHMAFNGTRNFEKQKLIDFMESIGMAFGPDVNAYTSFDETVYMLKIPTDKQEVVRQAFQILDDWSQGVTFENAEIDKERPVVVEEWRSGRGASTRIRDQQWPILFRGSKYAERMPIGEKQIIETGSHEALRRFYRDWYRPDLIAVVAVGDFEVSAIENLIRSHFSKLKNPKKEKPREIYRVPPHEETRFAIASDPEYPRTNIQVLYKSEMQNNKTLADARRALVEGLMFAMLNQRLSEKSKEADPPFLSAFSGKQRYVGTVEALTLGATVNEASIERGFAAVLQEARRAQLHGFLESELQRLKADVQRQIEKRYENRDKTESEEFAYILTDEFLTGEPEPGIEWLFEFMKEYLPGITLAEINVLARAGFEGKNRVVLVSLPQKTEIVPPSEATLATALDRAKTSEVTAYEESIPEGPLVKDLPSEGTIDSETVIPEVAITEWKLSNGIRVLLKPTDFKNDEILFTAWSPGGSSLVADQDAVSAERSDEIAVASGVSGFDEILLGKMLAGKIAQVRPYVALYYEGLSGRSAPKDLETALQLVHLRFTAPRMDPQGFASFVAKQTTLVENRRLQPEARFQDEFSRLRFQNHFRMRPPSIELLKEIDHERAFQIYKERFADADDFTFAFVGSFQVNEIKPLILKYLGSLPSLKSVENWKDLKIRPPEGVIEKEYFFGSEPKSTVIQLFHGKFSWSTENRILIRVLCDYLSIRLREVLREDLGGVYGVSIFENEQRIPEQSYEIFIRFGCDPQRVDELVHAVKSEIESLKVRGVDAEDFAKVHETLRRRNEVDLKDNGYWLAKIESAYRDEEDVRGILQFQERLKRATPELIRELARTYLDSSRYMKAVLMPQKKEP